MISIGEFTPDQPALNNSGATEAKNVIPGLASYRPFKALAATGNAISARGQGACSYRDTNLSINDFCGDASKLYRFITPNWDDASKGGGYTTATTAMWRFAQFGNLCLAVNGFDPVQTFTMGSSTDFADLAGTPPAGPRHIAVVRDYVIVARDTTNTNAVSWCDTNTPTNWSTGNADSQTMADGGKIMGLAGGENIRVFQETAIRLGTPTVAPDIFTFDKVAADRGLFCEYSLASTENMDFFVSHDDICMLVNGIEIVPIGAEKVNRYFFADLNSSYTHRVTGSIDPANSLYVLSYPSTSSADGTPDKSLVYNWQLQRWSRAVFDHEFVYPAISTANKSILAAFTTLHKLGYFTGSNLAATVTTGEAELSPGMRSFVSGVRPMVDGGTPTITLTYRSLPTDATTSSSAVSAETTTGVCPFRVDSRFFRAQIDVAAAATWTHIQGVEPEFRPAGYR